MNSKVKFLGIAVLLAMILAAGLLRFTVPDDVQADAVTNYWTFTMEDGTTALDTDGGQSDPYFIATTEQPGQIVVHIDADASATTSTLTTYMWYSNEPVNCASTTSWFTATDYLPYTTDAVGALSQVVGGEIASTTNVTANHGTSTTTPYIVSSAYVYSAPVTYTVQAANAAGGGYNSVVQSLAVTGDAVTGRDFVVYGRCLKLNYTVSFGTITPTVYIQKRDYYQ